MKTSKLMYLLSALTALTALFIAAFLLHMIQDVSNRANALDLERSKQSVIALKQSIREQAQRLVEDNAKWDDAAINAYGKANKEWLADTWGLSTKEGNYDAVYVLDEVFNTIIGYADGKPVKHDAVAFFGPPLFDLITKLPKSTKKFESSSAFFKTLRGNSIVAAVTIVPHTDNVELPRGQRRILVFSKTLTADELQRIGNLYVLKDLKLAADDIDKTAVIGLVGADESKIGYLTWQQERPGDEAKAAIQTQTMVAIAAMVGCMLVLMVFSGRLSSGLHKSQAKAWEIAITDTLTKLPNRFATTEHLAEKTANSASNLPSPLTVMLADVDGFKEVNDTYGHQIGDQLLKIIASGLGTIAERNSALVSRLGGDEFAFILDGNDCAARAEAISQAALQFLSAPLDLDGRIVRVGISIGITTSVHRNVVASEMLRQADVAMYTAKANGKNQFCQYSPELDTDRNARIKMASGLSEALKMGNLTVAYQPTVDAWSQKVNGVEALARWQLPSGEWVQPDSFIGVAEEFGLIDQLGNHVLATACAAIAPLANLKLSVNISPAQFRNPRFVENCLEIIDNSGLPRDRLEFEVTEGYLINQHERAQPIIKQLQSAGIKVALDDFGTGYSSIGYLRQYRFDKLKIDKSLIHGMTTDDSARSIIQVTNALARSMNMTVTAEGVEHEEEATLLRLAGCDTLQGYHFGKAQSVAAIIELIAAQDKNQVAA